MCNLFLEDADLLESIYIESELVEEAGLIIDKHRLEDPEYIKDLSRDIRDGKIKYTVGNIVTLLLFAPIPLTPAAIPFCVLVNLVLHHFITGLSKDEQKRKSKQKVVTNLSKMINKYESNLSKVTDKEDKKRLEEQIKKLKANRETIEKA